MEHEIIRKCIACSEKKSRDEMIKITFEKSSGKFFINPNSKIFGRSIYLCYNNSCVKEILKKNRLEKALKTSNTKLLRQQLEDFHKEQIYDKLNKEQEN